MTAASKVFIVTGAGRGIGRATAHRLVQDGHQVLAVDINADELEQTRLGRPRESAVQTLEQNVTEDSAPGDAIAAAMKHFGQVDGLVNNAGMLGSKSLDQQEDVDYDRLMAVMSRAPFRYSREVIRHLAGREGAIVHISSAFAIIGSPGGSTYAAAKASLMGLTRQMAADYGPRGIRTNAIAPGLIATAMTQDRIDNSDAFRRLMIETTPYTRIGRPEDIAAAVSFLLSPDAEFINGHVLAVDGGCSRTASSACRPDTTMGTTTWLRSARRWKPSSNCWRRAVRRRSRLRRSGHASGTWFQSDLIYSTKCYKCSRAGMSRMRFWR